MAIDTPYRRLKCIVIFYDTHVMSRSHGRARSERIYPFGELAIITRRVQFTMTRVQEERCIARIC